MYWLGWMGRPSFANVDARYILEVARSWQCGEQHADEQLSWLGDKQHSCPPREVGERWVSRHLDRAQARPPWQLRVAARSDMRLCQGDLH